MSTFWASRARTVIDGVPNSIDGVPNSIDGVLNSIDGVLNSIDGALNSIDGALNSIDGVQNSASEDRSSDHPDRSCARQALRVGGCCGRWKVEGVGGAAAGSPFFLRPQGLAGSSAAVHIAAL